MFLAAAWAVKKGNLRNLGFSLTNLYDSSQLEISRVRFLSNSTNNSILVGLIRGGLNCFENILKLIHQKVIRKKACLNIIQNH